MNAPMTEAEQAAAYRFLRDQAFLKSHNVDRDAALLFSDHGEAFDAQVRTLMAKDSQPADPPPSVAPTALDRALARINRPFPTSEAA